MSRQNKQLMVLILLFCNFFHSFVIMQWSQQVPNNLCQEDKCLLKFYEEVQLYNRWKEISKKMKQCGFKRSQIQCRNRYHNKINPDLSSDKWSIQELQKIFKFYDEYGPKWNLIEAFLPGRTQNNIKNRYFSALKNLLRKILKSFDEVSQQNWKYIPSKDITQIYEGRGKYKKFKGLMKKILKEICYQIEMKNLVPVIQMHKKNLFQLAMIFTKNEEKISFQVKEQTKQKPLSNSPFFSEGSLKKEETSQFVSEENQKYPSPLQNAQTPRNEENKMPFILIQPNFMGGWNYLPVWNQLVQAPVPIQFETSQIYSGLS